MDGELIPGASGVIEASSATEAYTIPRELGEALTNKSTILQELQTATTQEQKFAVYVKAAQPLVEFVMANPTNQMLAEEYAQHEVSKLGTERDDFTLGIIATYAQKAGEQNVTEEEIAASGGMHLNESSEGPNMVESQADGSTVSRDTQADPGTEAQSSQPLETPETINWHSLNRAQKKEVLGRHRMDKKPVRPTAPLAVLKDDAPADAQLSVPAETVPSDKTGQISTQAESVLGGTPVADQEYMAGGTTPAIPEGGENRVTSALNLDAHLVRTIPETPDAHGTTPFPEQPYSAKMAEWGKVSGTMSNDNSAAGESTGSQMPVSASAEVKSTTEPIRSMSPDNSAAGPSMGSKTPAITSLEITPAADEKKVSGPAYTAKLANMPPLNDSDTVSPSVAETWDRAKEAREAHTLKVWQEAKTAYEQSLGAPDSKSESVPLASRNPRIGPHVAVSVATGLTAALLPGIASAPDLQAASMTGRTSPVSEVRPLLPVSSDEATHKDKELSSEKLFAAGKTITIPRDSSISEEIAKLSTEEGMSADSFKSDIYTNHPDRAIVLLLMNMQTLMKNSGKSMEDVWDYVEKAHSGDEQAYQNVRSMLNRVMPEDQITVYTVDQLDLISKLVFEGWQKGGPEEARRVLESLNLGYYVDRGSGENGAAMNPAVIQGEDSSVQGAEAQVTLADGITSGNGGITAATMVEPKSSMPPVQDQAGAAAGASLASGLLSFLKRRKGNNS